MNFGQLRAFCSVVELGGFSRAGRRLHLSQSAISLQVKRLEDELGVELLERRGRGGSRLTPEGEVAYSHFVQILEREDGLRGSLEAVRRGAAGVLRVGATLMAHMHLLPTILSEFRRRNPQLRVKLWSGDVPKVLDALDRREIDLGIVWSPVDEAIFEQTPLLQDELLVVVPPQHPLARRSAVLAGELAHYPVLLYDVHSSTRAFVTDRLQAAGVVLQRPIDVGSPPPIKEAVLAGLGIGFLSPHAVRREILAGELAAVRPVGLNLRRQLVMVRLRGSKRTCAEGTLATHLLRSLEAKQRAVACVRRIVFNG